MSEEEYISSTFYVSILEFFEKYIDSKTVTFYIVEVKKVSKKNWKLEKRYSEFENFHKNIIQLNCSICFCHPWKVYLRFSI